MPPAIMGKTVLVADNDRVLVAAIGDALRAEGFTVSVAFDGLEALDVARRVRPDVILLDLIMPKMDGRRVCRLLKADPLLAKTPVVVLTGLGPERLASAAQLGAAACLPKGPLEEMLVDLRRLLRHYGEGRVATALPPAPSAPLLRGRRIVAELHALGRHLETILATLGEGIVEVDAEGRVVSVNPAGLALLGRPEEELIGIAAAGLLGGECEEDVRALLAPAGGGPAQPRSRVLQHRDATLHLTASELRDEEGDAGSILVLQDLTEVSQKLEELTALEEIARLLSGQPDPAEAFPAVLQRVRTLLRGTAAALFRWNEPSEEPTLALWQGEDGGVSDAVGERTALSLGKQAIAQGSGMGAAPQVALPTRGEHPSPAGVAVPLPEAGGGRGALVVLRTGGPPFARMDARFLGLAATHIGKALETAALYRRLSEHATTLEEKVRVRTQELEAASRHKSEFLAHMSHELRTPLNGILGFAQLLESGLHGPLTERQRRFVGNIQRSGEHLRALIGDILDLAKVEAGRLALRPEMVSLPAAYREAIAPVSEVARKKGLELSADIPVDLPPLWVDGLRLKQILYNLLANAVKFTPQGGRVTITARRVDWSSSQLVHLSRPIDQPTDRPIDAPEARQVKWSSGQLVDLSGPIDDSTVRPIDSAGEFVEIRVTDTGIGIRPEDLPRLFQEFAQLDNSVAKQHEGSGLGLALTRRLVELHGGRVRAESAGEGQGSTFIVQLRLRALPYARILVAEDDAAVRVAIEQLLQTEGFAVEIAADGLKALRRILEEPLDLVILDLRMPGIDGWEILRRLADSPRAGQVPILVLSGSESVNAADVLALGASDFLTKPFSPAVLSATIHRLLPTRHCDVIRGGAR